MSLTLASPKVPAQFAGQARQFCDRIAAEDRDSGEGIAAITAAMEARVKRGNLIPRRDALAGAAREWQHSLPPFSRLAIDVDLNVRKRSLVIAEMRLSAGVFRDQTWFVNEPGLLLMMIGLETRPHFYNFAPHTIAHIGMHALARRMQRGLHTSDAAVMADLRMLGQAHHGLADAEDGSDFAVPVTDRGCWRGAVRLVRDSRLGFDMALTVRTYLADGV